jgi:hypothetical protein
MRCSRHPGSEPSTPGPASARAGIGGRRSGTPRRRRSRTATGHAAQDPVGRRRAGTGPLPRPDGRHVAAGGEHLPAVAAALRGTRPARCASREGPLTLIQVRPGVMRCNDARLKFLFLSKSGCHGSPWQGGGHRLRRDVSRRPTCHALSGRPVLIPSRLRPSSRDPQRPWPPS